MPEPRQVADRYRRLELLGEGGAGQVWLVEDSMRPGTRLALKEALGDDDGRAVALRREFVYLSRLRHPSLVEVFDLDTSPADGSPRFTLEYVDGESLAESFDPAKPDFFLEMVAETLWVLAYLHDFGLVHRDLKPAHLMIRRRPRLGCRLALLDLGLAAAGEQPSSTESGPAVGTLPYIAPETFDGAPPNARSDLYSLGVVLYEVLHGVHRSCRWKRTFADSSRRSGRDDAAGPNCPRDFRKGSAPGWSRCFLQTLPPDRPRRSRRWPVSTRHVEPASRPIPRSPGRPTSPRIRHRDARSKWMPCLPV